MCDVYVCMIIYRASDRSFADHLLFPLGRVVPASGILLGAVMHPFRKVHPYSFQNNLSALPAWQLSDQPPSWIDGKFGLQASACAAKCEAHSGPIHMDTVSPVFTISDVLISSSVCYVR